MPTDTATNGASKRRPISWATRQWVKERDKYRCVDCGTHENLTVDHIIAVTNGGTNDVENLTTRCQSCNSRKGTKSETEHHTRSSPSAGEDRQDRLTLALSMDFDHRSLVGSLFHSDHRLGWQGCVVAEPSPGIYLVELFDWTWGQSSAQRLVRLDEMSDWQFYDTGEWMQNIYDRVISRQWEREREEARKGEICPP